MAISKPYNFADDPWLPETRMINRALLILCFGIASIHGLTQSRNAIKDAILKMKNFHKPDSRFHIWNAKSTFLHLRNDIFANSEDLCPNDFVVLASQEFQPEDERFDAQVVESYVSDSGIQHYYLKQTYNGEIIFNADMNVNMDEQGNIVSIGESFWQTAVAQETTSFEQRIINPSEIISHLNNYFSFYPKEDDSRVAKMFAKEKLTLKSKFNDITTAISLSMKKLESMASQLASKTKTFLSKIKSPISIKKGYVITAKGLIPAFNVEIDIQDHWLNLNMCLESGEIFTVNDWVADASYNVFPIGVNDPKDGHRSLVYDPEDPIASPKGWSTGPKPTTKGNNVVAQANWSGKSAYLRNYRPNVTNDQFDFPLDLSKEPHSYVDAAITNLFYWNNVMHDITYTYGFTELAGNFQDDNYGKGGRGRDPVIADAQNGAGMNNADFATPPDGSKPRMRMFLWDVEKPKIIDGDLDAGIIIHEYMHGVSTRLVGNKLFMLFGRYAIGGPRNSNCMYNGEAGGMGEGWGDLVSLMLRMRPEYNSTKSFLMGSYVFNGKTIRKYPYSLDKKINPETYGSIKKWDYFEVHAKGEVWAEILFEVYWAIAEEYGFDPDWYNGKGGNNIFMYLIIDSLKLQPCNPSFVNARDAIIQADEVRYNGDNHCLLWKSFARRGLGFKAKAGGNEDFTLPDICN